MDTESLFLFKPGQYGPYSDQLDEELDALISGGFIVAKELNYTLTYDVEGMKFNMLKMDPVLDRPQIPLNMNRVIRYTLSERGRAIASGLWSVSIRIIKRIKIKRFKSIYSSMPLSQLIIHIYEKYPEYIGVSEMRKKLFTGK